MESGFVNAALLRTIPASVPSPLQRFRRFAIDVTPLRVSRDYRLLWTGELVSQIGSQITLVALFVQVYRLTHSNAAVGVVGVVQLVPMVLVSVGLGPQIDRRDRRRLLLLAQVGLMSATAVLYLASLAGDPPLGVLYGAAALSAAFMSLAMPTRAAITPNLIAPELLSTAAALNQAMWSSAAVVGPAVGGVIVGRFGLPWAYGIDLATFVVALTCAFAIRSQRPHVEPGDQDRGLAAIAAGFRYLRGRRVLQSTFTVDIVAMVFGMPRAVFPALAATVFHRGPEVVGWLFAAPAAGALIGALSSGWVGGVRRHGLAILLAVTAWGLAITAFGLAGDHLLLALLFLAIAGAADVVSAVFRGTLQQLVVPDALRGRLAAFNIFVVAGGPRLGDLEAGVVAAAFTPTVAIISGGLLCLGGVAVIAAAVPQFARWHVGDAA
ncbi:MAG TPA: MFS transporter [Acidimicrobiia bacterium]|nr:MFS transporter [Acidimicrobiia bacterium]